MIAFVFAVGALGAATETPTPQQVLARVAEYVEAFEQRLSGIVSEEQYRQEVRGKQKDIVEWRHLKSDLLLVRPIGSQDWMQFRDVFEVDGIPVRDRHERLVDIFLNPTSNTESQTTAIISESKRYNVGVVERSVNTPTIALHFLERDNQRGIEFRRTRNASPHHMTREAPVPPEHFRPPNDAWVIAFRERRKPTFLRTLDHKHPASRQLVDLPARGRFWIDPASGRVLMSELELDATGARAVITVTYAVQPLLGFLIPSEMRERYDRLRNGTSVEGFASYGRTRQFQVLVDETLGPIKK